MKSWFVFGSGLLCGVILGAFLASFLLFDDFTKQRPQAVPATAVSLNDIKPAKVARNKVQKVAAPVPAVEVKPAAVAAEAVDLNSLPPAEEGVIATARRDDDTSIDSSPQ